MIDGNGHTISNVNLEQTDVTKQIFGLFGKLGDTAVIKNLTFSNVTVTIKTGIMLNETYMGLLAGVVSEQAQFENVKILSSQLVIDENAMFLTNVEYAIGQVFGQGQAELTEIDITCEYQKEGYYAMVVDGLVQIMEGEKPEELPEEQEEQEEQPQQPEELPEDAEDETEDEEEEGVHKPTDPDQEKEDDSLVHTPIGAH